MNKAFIKIGAIAAAAILLVVTGVVLFGLRNNRLVLKTEKVT